MKLTIYSNSFAIIFVLLVSRSFGSAVSIGPNGINSAGLGLTGAGIDIGQVELFRPGDPKQPNGSNFDPMSLSNSSVNPAGVFFRQSPPINLQCNT